jgi:hypothetical protein
MKCSDDAGQACKNSACTGRHDLEGDVAPRARAKGVVDRPSSVMLARVRPQVILPAADDEEDALQNTSGDASPMTGCAAEGEPYTPQMAVLPQPRTPVPGLLPRPSTAARQTRLRLMMRGARELAVMGSISHPNIVQVRSCVWL